MKILALLEKIKGDVHTPVAVFVFLVTTVIHVVTNKDLGPQYVNSLYAFYAFLGGHAFTQAKYNPDDPDTAVALAAASNPPGPDVTVSTK